MHTAERERLQNLIKESVERFGCERGSLISILRDVQTEYGYISDIAMQEIADMLGIFPIQVQEVVSFYSFLTTEKLGKYVIRLAHGTPREVKLMKPIARQFENELGIQIGQTTDDGMFTLQYTSCIGMSDQAPALMVNNNVFTKVTPEDVHDIIYMLKEQFGKLDPKTSKFCKNIKKAGEILAEEREPNAGLKKALDMSRVDIIAEIRESGLRGRGGAGFPAAVKLQLAAAVPEKNKIIVCNADEGEPGTFKDRLLLTDYADLVFDGMTIAAYSIGSSLGYLYLRSEYTFVLEALEAMLKKRREDNLLGENILGKGFNFDIKIRMGAGAYVCGEETALIESLEGKRGEPRNRPPFPVSRGFNNNPTSVHNVESFVDIAKIIEKGGKWFANIGTKDSKGPKLLSVSGDCERPGIYELPFGITITELLAEVGGENAKAVQVGGASGTTVPRSDFSRKIAYEDVATGGSIMVFGPDTDMLTVAENFMEFFVEESCGQCVPCRLGCTKLLQGIELLKEGKCSIKHLRKLKDLGHTMQKASKCGLGQAAPNAFLTIIEDFKNDVLGR